jgi:DMSO/TMAO reductase YedYZ heme-binding membrane subunit
MSKFFTCTLVLLLTTVSFCQQTDTHSLTRQDYLGKSKKQKTAAWVLLGGGATVAVGAAILDVSGDWSKSETPYLVAIAAGGASMLGSIPLFIASGRNKRKAMNASTWFEIRKQPFPTSTGIALHGIPTLSLKLNF